MNMPNGLSDLPGANDPTPLLPRELVPVTRLTSASSVTAVNGVLTIVRVLKAA